MHPKLYPFHVDCVEECEELAELLEAFFIGHKKFHHYYFQLEYSAKKKHTPWHLQGWVYSDYSESYLEKDKNPFRALVKPKLLEGFTYSFAPLRKTINEYIGYICKNADKPNIKKHWKSYSQDLYDELLSDCHPYISSKDFQNAVNEFVPKKKSTDQLVDEIIRTCVCHNLCKEPQLNYRMCYERIKKFLPKTLDVFIWERNMYGITFRVEQKINHPNCKRTENYFDRIFFEKEINKEIFY